MSEENEGQPVYSCARSDWTPEEKPIGHAASDREALRMIKKFLSERDGSDYELTVQQIIWSKHIGNGGGYCVDD